MAEIVADDGLCTIRKNTPELLTWADENGEWGHLQCTDGRVSVSCADLYRAPTVPVREVIAWLQAWEAAQ